ncbi:MAG: hypothetical protein C5B50_25095 [Verrucomicrobia bacterium]|nr:MAG: hypothetical protein C5B50_25095 [Verrucomicrobiota bacterium]
MLRVLHILLWVAAIPFSFSACQGKNKTTINVTCAPRFEQRGDFVYLVIRDSIHSYEVGYSMPPRVVFLPVSLDTNRIYTFTISEKPLKGTKFKSSTVLRVQADEKVIYDEEICEVHHTRMQQKKVPILYGLLMRSPDEPPWEDEQKLFPHRNEVVSGGCCPLPEKTEIIYLCNQCKMAYEQWRKQHPSTRK